MKKCEITGLSLSSDASGGVCARLCRGMRWLASRWTATTRRAPNAAAVAAMATSPGDALVRQSCQQKSDGPSRERPHQRGADSPGNARREEPPLAHPLQDVEENGRQEDAKQRHPEHAAEHRRSQRPPHLRPGPLGEDEREHAQDEGERRHQDRPQPQAGRFGRRLKARFALLVQLPGEFHDQNRVLARQSDQHDQADLHEDIDVLVREEHAG